ncbi:MAG: class I SAM-dependent methyltransferase [Chloroflexi bacterium]|nr:MAG: class I SAM-dependent methyltransferase [Chloroflexota bacterium]
MGRFRRMAAAPARRLLRSLAAARVGRRLLSRAESEISLALATPSTEDVSTGREKWHTPEPAEPYLGSGRQPLDRLTSYCWIEDWSNAALVAAMRRQLPYLVEKDPRFPENLEHRKHWEYAQVVVGLEQLGALHQDALVLGVGAGHEEAIYDLSTRVRWLFATDIYGSGYFRAGEADARMLLDPDHFARCPYNRNRLVVENMDALDLRFEDRTFDAVYSLSSIEHFGGLAGATRALDEMARVASSRQCRL